MADLIFSRSPSGANLVFGVTGSADTSEVTLSADIPDPQLSALVAEPLFAAISADFPAFEASVEASYGINVQRPVLGHVRTDWQEAVTAACSVESAWHSGASVVGVAVGRWQGGRAVQNVSRAAWADGVHVRSLKACRWQDGRRRHAAPVRARWQDGHRARVSSGVGWQDGARIQHVASTRWQDADHRKRASVSSAWQDGARRRAHVSTRIRAGSRMPLDLRARWQDGIVPAPGKWVADSGGTGTTPRTPDPNLLFAHTPTGAALVFHADSDYTPAFVIPIRSTYMIFNEVTLRRTDSGASVQPLSLDVSIDRDSWTWNWSADVAYSEWAALAAMNGEPLELEATINGYRWLLVAEGAPRRSRAFGTTTVKIQGRGIASELDEPVADVQNFYGSEQLTAQQLMAKALTYNGASLGWELDWQITDWTVPAGIWSVTGAPIAGVLNVAEAIKAVIQADRESRILHVLPRYPSAPWEWSALTPAIEIPPDIVSTDEIEPVQKTAYNAIYVSGQVSGNLSRVYRSGTAADKLAQMVSHPLLTETAANRQRGIAELSDTGRMALVTITLPLSDDTSLLEVGQLANMTEAADPWRGLIAGTGVSARYAEGQGLTVSQSATLERHYE